MPPAKKSGPRRISFFSAVLRSAASGVLLTALLGARPGVETGQAEFLPASRLELSAGLGRYRDPGVYGTAQHVFDVIPVGIRYALARNVQLGLFWPLVAVENLANPLLALQPAAGDILFELAFGREDPEYGYREAFVFRTRIIDASPPVPRARAQAAAADFNRDAQNRDYYPFILHNRDMTFGWNFTKRLEGRTRLHASASYVYEFNTNESLTNVFAFNGLIDQNPSNAGNTAGFSNFQGAQLSLFGIEKIFQKLFWTTSLTDPWSDKRNDHVEVGLAADTTFDLRYDFAGTPVDLSVTPFAEVFATWRFSPLALVRSHVESSLGAEWSAGPRLRWKAAFTRVLWAESGYDWTDGVRLEASVLF